MSKPFVLLCICVLFCLEISRGNRKAQQWWSVWGSSHVLHAGASSPAHERSCFLCTLGLSSCYDAPNPTTTSGSESGGSCFESCEKEGMGHPVDDQLLKNMQRPTDQPSLPFKTPRIFYRFLAGPSHADCEICESICFCVHPLFFFSSGHKTHWVLNLSFKAFTPFFRVFSI